MFEKTPLKSKKFIAYLIAEFAWKVVILFALYFAVPETTSGGIWNFLIAVVVLAGFVEVGFIGGQAWLEE